MSTTSTAVRDLRSGWRRALAVILPVPAAIISAEMALRPYGLFATPAERLAAASSTPGRIELVTWLVLAGLLLCVPAAMGLAWAVRRSAPRLALAGGLLTIVGFAMSITMPSSELLSSAAVRAGTDVATFDAVAAALEGHPVVGVTTFLFLVGQAVGLLLLGLALWRTPAAPRWAAVALAASGVLHVALSFDRLAATTSWLLSAIGFAGASVVLWRLTDDEFDLPPTGRGRAVSGAPGASDVDRDARRVWQRLLAVTAPLAAAAIAIGRFAMPFSTLDSPEVAFDKLVASPGFTTAQTWFGLLSPMIISGVLAVLWLTRRRVPVLATVAAVLCVPGYLALEAADSVSPILADLVAHGRLEPAAVRPIAAALEAMPQPTVVGTIFVVGHLLGTVLLGIALWRSGALPGWVGILLTVSQPLHLVAAMTSNHPLDLAAWGATAVCMGLAGGAVLRQPAAEFDLPPLPVAPTPAAVTAAGLPAHG